MGTSKDFEWSRERLLRMKKKTTKYDQNRSTYLVNEIRKNHGEKAVREIAREFNSK